jgi:hypothetical protein
MSLTCEKDGHVWAAGKCCMCGTPRPGELSLEESIDNFAATANRIADQLIEEREINGRLMDALKMMYDKWENGTPCHEAVDSVIDEDSTSIGNCFNLSFAEEQTVLNLIIEKAEDSEDPCANCGKPYRAHLLHDGNKCAPGKPRGWFPRELAAATAFAKAVQP